MEASISLLSLFSRQSWWIISSVAIPFVSPAHQISCTLPLNPCLTKLWFEMENRSIHLCTNDSYDLFCGFASILNPELFHFNNKYFLFFMIVWVGESLSAQSSVQCLQPRPATTSYEYVSPRSVLLQPKLLNSNIDCGKCEQITFLIYPIIYFMPYELCGYLLMCGWVEWIRTFSHKKNQPSFYTYGAF